ncbi:hypothetical protein QFC19_000058 [Naganishia cerealis]|uniref:Uncharacterized protein n=1 Tax=Naganishia cerealis TaxID=610337 RepID=A0ACC2WRR9_9TREE|nr:hypothetical protein QFC19_000058 [Naganishia cerealis]
MKKLLRSMIQPEPRQRITAQMAYHHHALDSDFQIDMSTPPFVRTAASLPIEPREKKQVPREQRDRKRSQALQAETGAKFIKEKSDAKVDVPEKRPKETPPLPNDVVMPELPAKSPDVPQEKQFHQERLEDSHTEEAKQSSLRKSDLSPQMGLAIKKPELGNTSSSGPVRELRRATSAMALQSNSAHEEDIQTREFTVLVNEKQQQLRGLGRQAEPEPRHDGQHRRHTRVLSEGCDRLLNFQLQARHDGDYRATASREPVRTRPRSQLSFNQATQTRQFECYPKPNKTVRFDGETTWDRAPLRQTTRIKDDIAELRNAPSSADIDAKLDRIALWVQDVELIVEEAKYALEAVQAERPPSRQMLRTVEVERRSEDGLQQSITIVRPPSAAGRRTVELRRPSSSTHLRYESNYELRPIIQAEDFRPTHLRRQRSDLTNFRSRADPTMEDLRRKEYELRGYDEWPETSKHMQFAKKLKTYRSTGDLHKFGDQPTNARERTPRETEPGNYLNGGWYRYDDKNALLIPETKKVAHESKLKSMLHSVKSMFKRRD